jgi:hypothetical protein
MSNFEDFSMKLLDSRSYDESFKAYNEYIEALGFKSMLYVFLPSSPFKNHQDIAPQLSVSDNFNQFFLEEYAERQLHKHDYIINAVHSGQERKLFLWESALKNKILNRQQQAVVNVAKHDYDMNNGFSILTSKNKIGTGVFSVIGDETDQFFPQHVEEQAFQFRLATESFHNHIVTRSYEVSEFIMPMMFSTLKITEKQVLKCLMEGFSVPQTAKKIFKSRGYVENLIRGIRIKVGGALPNGKPRISKDRLICFCSLMRIHDEL